MVDNFLLEKAFDERLATGDVNRLVPRAYLLYTLNIFWILSPVWTLESCVLETDMNLDGWRKQFRAVRRSEDINVDLMSFISSYTFLSVGLEIGYSTTMSILVLKEA